MSDSVQNGSHVGENFDLKDLTVQDPNKFHLLNLRDVFSKRIDENVHIFETLFRPLYDQGRLLYHRQICSPVDTRVTVLDHATGAHKRMLMFGSNNYLGFANEASIKQAAKHAIDEFGVGMAGPMILNGRGSLQKTLEERLAGLKGKEAAMVLPTGYQANLAWVNSIMTDNAILLYDEASHASLIDAIRMGRKKAFRFLAQDMSNLEEMLKKYRLDDADRDIFVCVQGVYSMSGEVADLKSVAQLCTQYQAKLVVDDAHGTGVLGQGRGTAEHFGVSDQVFLTMGTFSKSFAVTGGFLAGDARTINFIRFFARPYFFTAAIPPMVAAAVIAGIDLIEQNPLRVARVRENAEYLRRGLKAANIQFSTTESAIVPVMPPPGVPFRELAYRVHCADLFVNPIEPPAVNLGSERFRMSVMATHSPAEIDEAVSILRQVFTAAEADFRTARP